MWWPNMAYVWFITQLQAGAAIGCQLYFLHLTLQTLILTLGPCFADVADVEQAIQIAAAHSLTIATKGGGWSWVRNVCYVA